MHIPLRLGTVLIGMNGWSCAGVLLILRGAGGEWELLSYQRADQAGKPLTAADTEMAGWLLRRLLSR